MKAAHDMELLEYLAAKAGCMYVSDLHLPAYQLMLGRIIRQMDAERYDMVQWNDAVQYITGSETVFASRAEAAEYLQGYSPAENI